MTMREAPGQNQNAPEEPATRKLRVFLVDDHFYIREGLKSLIRDQPDMEVIGEADSGEAACRMARTCSGEKVPDILVMDYTLTGMNGADATREIKQACPQIRIVALSMHEDRNYLHTLLDAGASGYVLKRSARHNLLQAMRAVASGGIYLDPSVAGIVAEFITRRPTRAKAAENEAAASGSDSDKLSEREESVLRLLAQGFSGKEVAAKLVVSAKSVESYKSRAMEKLGLNTRVEMVRYAARQGWL